jgi:AcrR family transcriptional regulator
VVTSLVEGRERRTRLLEAGNAVFSEVGYTGATVDDLIERASTSRATFYRYFRNKDDLFNELSRACFRDMRAIVEDLGRIRAGQAGADVGEAGAGGGEAAEIERVLGDYRQLHARHAGVIRAWWERVARHDPGVPADEGRVFDQLVASLAGLVSASRVGSRVAADAQAALLYLLVEGSYSAVTSRWSRIDPDTVAPTLARMIQRTYFGGDVSRRGPVSASC